MNEESKKAGNAENQNPLASSSRTSIRSFSHYPARSSGGALLSSSISSISSATNVLAARDHLDQPYPSIIPISAFQFSAF